MVPDSPHSFNATYLAEPDHLKCVIADKVAGRDNSLTLQSRLALELSEAAIVMQPS